MALLGIGSKKDDQEPEYINSVLNTPMLNYKVYVMSRPEQIAVRAILLALGGLAGLIFYGGLFKDDGDPTFMTTVSNAVVFVGMGILANVAFVPIYKESRLESRKAMLSRQFRDMLDALASSFSTGSNVTMAFRATRDDLLQQYDEDDFIVREMNEIVAAERQSVPIAIMLRSFAERSGDDDIQSFADVFDTLAHKGGDMSVIVQRMRALLVEKSEVSEEIRTMLTSNKLQLNAMSAMPFVIVVFLRFVNESFAENFATPVGVACCTVALVIIFAAYRYGQKIVNVRV